LVWKIEFDGRAQRELDKLDGQTQRNILRYLRRRIATPDDPRRFGGALRQGLTGLWRYRVGKYRLICQIQDERVVVLVLRAGHRGKIYHGKN